MKVIEILHNNGYDVDIYIVAYDKPPIIKYHGKTLKPYLRKSSSKWQYPIVNIPNHGEQYCHRIVAYSIRYKVIQMNKLKAKFPNETIVVDHINGNTLDYSPSNLQFLTNSQNVLKASKMGENRMIPISIKQAKILKLEMNPEWFAEN